MAVVRHVLLLSFSLWLIGCTDKIQIAPRDAQDAVTSPLKLDLANGLLLKESKRKIAQRLAEGLPVSYTGVTDALLETHHENWVARHPKARNPSFKNVLSTFHSLASPFSSSELPQIKEEIETRAGDFVHPQTLVYNARAISALDAPYDKRIQSYSGTLLFLMTLRQALGAEGVAKQNLVVIFESGHVLPGYFVKNGDQWELNGIETTVAGTGQISYGPMNEAIKTRVLRVVDADLFILVDLYKFDALNLKDLANQALTITAEKYHFALNTALDSAFVREVKATQLDWTPFSFGSRDTRDQDRERAPLTKASRNELPHVSPNMTIQHAKAATSTEAEPAAPTIEKATMNPYPFRQVQAPNSPNELISQCWDYVKQAWVDIPHRKEGEKFFIRFNPCAYSKEHYEPVPPPLFLEPVVTPAPYSIYSDEDWDY